MKKRTSLLLLAGIMCLSLSVVADALDDCITGCEKNYTAGSAGRTKCVQNCYAEN